jgi:two-component system cell cycle response regulator
MRTKFALALVDVDNFKTLNDTKGHTHGDETLKLVAQTLLGTSRTEDVVGRYAGDEFVVLINNCDGDLARILVFPLDATGEHGLIEAADRALYNTKRAGKNGFSFY